MPTGLKQTSSLIVIGARVVESAANTFTQGRIDLQLNPLDNEVFVVVAVDLDPAFPDQTAGARAALSFAMTTTNQAAFPLFNSSNVIGQKIQVLDDTIPGTGTYMATGSLESPATSLDYLAIISTNDFFLQVQGANNAGAKAGNVKVYGYRARADSSVYAALVQSEVLSA
tara:strand:+ start:1122 stop:1631 length:510 start_codon:yes stop_codon:yes gene_type:complete